MSKGFRLDPIRRLFGSFGSLWWQGLKGIEQELEIGANGKILTVVSGQPAWADAPSGGASTLDGLTDVDTSGVADGDVLVYDSGSGLWVPGTAATPPPTTYPFGVVMEWGDGYTADTVLTGQLSRGRVIAPGAGVTLQSIRVDAAAAVSCQLDILLNGASIFGAGSTKPFLTSGTTYHDTTFAGTVDRTWNDDDLLVGQIVTLTGDPLQLAMTLAWE
jgi:hypothetical protein